MLMSLSKCCVKVELFFKNIPPEIFQGGDKCAWY